MKHYHIAKQSQRRGGGKSKIVEHHHPVGDACGWPRGHAHEGLTGFATARSDIERQRDLYDIRLANYRANLRGRAG